ncbi:MAG: GNAT family N-acetyltransferase [Ginsengibacter sp.]
MIFETDRLLVRKWQEDDLQQLHNLFADEAISGLVAPPLTMAETRKIFDEQMIQYSVKTQTGRYFIIDKENDQLIGTFLLRKSEDHAVEIGYALIKKEWGKGYATEIVKRGIEYVFNSTEFEVIHAYTDLANFSSKNVLEKCGFTHLVNSTEFGTELNLFSIEKES